MSTRVWHRMVSVVLSLGFASLPVKAQMVGPLANTTVGNARLIVPDGSSLRQSISTGETRWFVFGAEPGKTYVVEAVDPDSDLVSNTIGALHVYAANGTTTPPPETNVDCTASTRAPAMELPVAVSGMRCVVRAFPPTQGNTQNKRGLYVAVGLVDGSSFDIRVRESTIYGRWTTNGYDFHVELQNTTADSMCAQVMLLPNSGNTYAGTWSGAVTTQQLTIPAFGANKLVFANGTQVGSDFRGTLRVGACSSPVNLMPSGLHVSTFAYNPLTDRFLYFFTNAANNGATANSWSTPGAVNAFVQGGNAFGTTAKLGTTDAQPLELLVANARALRIEPAGSDEPNIIGGSPANRAATGIIGATIAGGGHSGSNCGPSFSSPCANSVTDFFGTVGGGEANSAGAGGYGTVAGGYSNTAVNYGTVGGGQLNSAGSFGTVAGGSSNTASGLNSTVPGGLLNVASGFASFAAGVGAAVSHDRSFLWCDGHAICTSQEANDFIVVASGGIKFYAQDGHGGCILIDPAGSGWQCASDRKLKENFATLDTRDVLRRVSEMPITRWNVKGSPREQHIGPVAQDFYAAFGLGSDDLHIGSSDISGVALAAIQGLNAKVEEQQREIADLRERVSAAESLRGELAVLSAELADIRETRTQITARTPAAADGFRVDAPR